MSKARGDQESATKEQRTSQEDSPHPGMGFAEFVTIVAAMMAVNALAIDIMLPALPSIGNSLNVTEENRIQLVITAYLIGFGFTQLFYGTLSDRYGRKPILIAGLLIYALFGALSVIATSFEQVLFARLMQGVGAAASRVIALSLVRDCYGGRRMAKVMSLVMIVFIAVPVVAPSLGQILVLLGPWRLIFAVLTVMGLVLILWTLLRLPETLPRERRIAISPKSIATSFRIVLTTRITVGYALAATVVMGSLFGFINSSQQIFVDVFEIGAIFPLAFASIALFMAMASVTNSRIVERLGMRRVSHSALLLFTAAGIVHSLINLLGLETVWLFIAMQAITMFAFGLVMPNFNSIAMDPVGQVAGTASSFLGFITTLGGALLGYFIGQAFNGTPLPMALGFAGLGIASTMIVLVTEKGRLFRGVYD
ncbi:multidrug effflux MFS transporter [Fodinicurvata sediminis]|uniref:multidrug effflux MFS transporter n=1 Tax=Fodinicurvata sediminis TaxID=1121832 RepID=UPI00040DF69F|nr:multidrug effflux MFS transporter [Fodinicurvata sediminis]